MTVKIKSRVSLVIGSTVCTGTVEFIQPEIDLAGIMLDEGGRVFAAFDELTVIPDVD